MEGRQIKTLLERVFKGRRRILILSYDHFVNFVQNKPLSEKDLLVVNESLSYNQNYGQHWFLVFIQNGELFLLDSMKKKRIELAVAAEFETYPITTLPIKIQSNSSQCCGLYSVYFAIQLCVLNRSLNAALRHFVPRASASNCRYTVHWIEKYVFFK